jgi:hypothetical protein
MVAKTEGRSKAAFDALPPEQQAEVLKLLRVNGTTLLP